MLAPLNRSPWVDHPRYTRQVLLVDSHDSFLAWMQAFRDRLAQLEDGGGLSERQRSRLIARLPDQFTDWQRSMACHERYEERKLYPFLERRFAVSTAALALDHAALHLRADQCVDALSLISRETPAPANFAHAYAAFGSYAESLHTHLHNEEALVIPLLLDLCPADFQAYATAGAEDIGALAATSCAV